MFQLFLLFTCIVYSCVSGFNIKSSKIHGLITTRHNASPSSSFTTSLSSTTSGGFSKGISASTRVQNLKDICFKKEILNDLSTCEFALRLQFQSKSGKINIDIENLLAKLENNLDIIQLKKDNYNEDIFIELESRVHSMKSELSKLRDEVIIATSSTSSSSVKEEEEDINLIDQQNEDILKDIPSINIVVRDDGTVDWDEALASSREVARFGAELWERINGKEVEEGIPTINEIFGQAEAKNIQETESTKRLRMAVDQTTSNLNVLLDSQVSMKQRLWEARDNGLVISQDDLNSMRLLDTRSKDLQKLLTLTKLDLDVERICIYLQDDIESSVDPVDQRLLVAEVNLIERQLAAIVGNIQLSDRVDLLMKSVFEGEYDKIYDNSNTSNIAFTASVTPKAKIAPSSSALLSLIDDDELALVEGEVNDLKMRLGIDTNAGKAVDWGSLGVLIQENVAKIKEGLAFWSDGTKMLISDVQYAWKLLIKAAGGYTLKAREVNTVRRTGKDILTLFPFTIILVIPVSPVGHVLVFSFIQRFFPDFFPSCYTEKRLNLRKLYSEIEIKSGEQITGGLNSGSLSTTWNTDTNTEESDNVFDPQGLFSKLKLFGKSSTEE